MILIAESVCNDYVLATILTIVKRGLTLIQIVVPILLLISGTIQFAKMMINPDEDKKGKKNFLNSIMAAVIVFFLPFLVNLTMSIINVNGDVGVTENGSLTAFDLTSCWQAVSEKQDIMDSANETAGTTINDDAVKNTTTNTTTTGGGTTHESSSGHTHGGAGGNF